MLASVYVARHPCFSYFFKVQTLDSFLFKGIWLSFPCFAANGVFYQVLCYKKKNSHTSLCACISFFIICANINLNGLTLVSYQQVSDMITTYAPYSKLNCLIQLHDSYIADPFPSASFEGNNGLCHAEYCTYQSE